MSYSRLRYSGMVLFLSRFLGVITGTIFTMIVTRRLMVDEFGAWQYINVLFTYFLIPSGFTGLWITRHVARGEKVVTTGLLINLLFSIPVTILFIIIAPLASNAANISPILFLVISPQILLLYVLSVLESVSSGIKPYLLGYGSILFELVKICIAVILVLYMRLGFIGTLITIEVAYALQSIFMLVALRKEFTRVFLREAAKKWLMLFWIPLFSSLAIQLQQLDSLVTVVIAGSTIPIAMLKAVQVFSTVVSFATYAGYALYPRLLAREDSGDVETSIRLISFLAIPSMLGSIVLAEPLLAILRKEYVVAAMALRISAVVAALVSVTNVTDAIILSTEKIDISGSTDFRSYMRSKLALIPTLAFIYDVAYLSIIYFTVSYLSVSHAQPETIATAIATIAFVVMIPQIVYKWRLARRLISFKCPLRSIASYVIAAGAMSIGIMVLNPLEAVSNEAVKVFFGLIPKIAVGGIIYLLICSILDIEPRTIMKGVLREIRLKLVHKNS